MEASPCEHRFWKENAAIVSKLNVDVVVKSSGARACRTFLFLVTSDSHALHPKNNKHVNTPKTFM